MAYTDGRAGSFQEDDETGEWNEYHGVGKTCNESGKGHHHPVGGVHFNDGTESGYHSHAVHEVPDDYGTSRVIKHRHENSRYDWCDDDDCDDRYGSYGRYGGGGRSGSWMNRGLGGSAEGYQDASRRGGH
jgi:hypothetical protein